MPMPSPGQSLALEATGFAVALASALCLIYYHHCRPQRTATRNVQSDVMHELWQDGGACKKELITVFNLRSILHQFTVLLLYGLSVIECFSLANLVDEHAHQSAQIEALVAAGYLVNAVAAELDHNPSAAPWPWRVRAVLRLASCLLLGSGGFLNAWDRPLHLDGGLVQPAMATLSCASLACLAIAGRPRAEMSLSPPHPLRRAALLPKLFFWFWWPEIRRVARIETRSSSAADALPLAVEDLPNLPPDQLVAATVAAAEVPRGRRERKAQSPGVKRAPLSLAAELIAISKRQLFLQWAWATVDVLGQFLAPLGMNGLVDAIGRGAVGRSCALYGAMVVFGPTIQIMASTQGFHNGWAQATKWRGYLTQVLTQKALTLDAVAANYTVGSMTNLLAVDTQFMMSLAVVAVWLVAELCKLALTLFLTIWLLGAASVGGFAVALIVLPLNAWSIRVVKRWQHELMQRKDARMTLVSEALGAIATLKHHGWESEFETRIAALRARELVTLRRIKLLEAMTGALINQTPLLAAIASFLCRTMLFQQALTAAQGFTSLALFGMLANVLGFLPMVINRYIQAAIAHQRIGRFLALRDVDGRTDDPRLPRGSVVIDHGSFAWPAPDDKHDERVSRLSSGGLTGAHGDRSTHGRAGMERSGPRRLLDEPLLTPSTAEVARTSSRQGHGHGHSANTGGCCGGPPLSLVSVHLAVAPGELVCIYGPCGSGKSSLLSALCGECSHVAGGRGILCGNVAFSPQRAWVANAPLRENILFGNPLVPAKYEAVLTACALRADLETMPAGDATEIGERGVNLSGGQAQRVSLARAVYAAAIGAADVVLLDDPLSALDAQVGAHVFAHAICGLLSHTTRLLVSHAVALTMPAASSVVLLEGGGRVVAQAAPDSDNPKIAALRDSANLALPFALAAPPSPLSPPLGHTSLATQVQAAAEPALPVAVGSAPASVPSAAPTRGAGTGRLVQREERARGRAKCRIYLVYIHAFGAAAFSVFVLVQLATAALLPVQSVMLKTWLDEMVHAEPPAWAGLERYLLAAGAYAFTSCLRDSLLPLGSVRASRAMHAQMASHVLRASLGWFQATPLGRILNRFSADIAAIDSELAGNFSGLIRSALSTVAAAAVCALGPGSGRAMAIVLLAVAVSLCGTMVVYIPYVKCAREQKRLESVTKSPLISTFTEASQSAALVRAFGVEQRTALTVAMRCDNANRSIFFLWTTNQWLRMQMSLIGSMVIGAVVGVLLWEYAEGTLTAGDAGLTLQFATQFIQLVQSTFRSKTFLEVLMNDVERVDEYSTSLPLEAYKGADPPPRWPSGGDVSFQSIRLQYKCAAEPIFDGLSFEVPPCTRIGVVGRTGAGKSSITVALLRLVELSAGKITIGGVDIRSIGLTQLRSRIALVSQDPTLLRGSVRYNLSPLASSADSDGGGSGSVPTDQKMMLALERAGLLPKIQAMPGGLDAQISEAGGNLSVGERQLLCMARALLREASLLLMDEATASVDGDADRRIQGMIRSEDCFGTATVMTIAHRLHTVAYYDRVLVLAKGRVAEHDTPLVLLQRAPSADGLHEGAFRRLAEGSGDLEGLLRIARGEMASNASSATDLAAQAILTGESNSAAEQ